MSRRKDRERFLEMKRLNPDYQGFRGPSEETAPTGESIPLQGVTCSVCHRRRNVAVEIAQEQGDNYVCLSCLEEAEKGAEAQEEPAATG